MKLNSWLLELLRDYSDLFILYNVKCYRIIQELNWQGLRPSYERKRENHCRVFAFSTNFEFGHCTSLFCRGRQGNVPNYITHVQDCFMPFTMPSSSCACLLEFLTGKDGAERRTTLFSFTCGLVKS